MRQRIAKKFVGKQRVKKNYDVIEQRARERERENELKYLSQEIIGNLVKIFKV